MTQSTVLKKGDLVEPIESNTWGSWTWMQENTPALVIGTPTEKVITVKFQCGEVKTYRLVCPVVEHWRLSSDQSQETKDKLAAVESWSPPEYKREEPPGYQDTVEAYRRGWRP